MQRKDGFVPSSNPGPGFTPKFLVIFMIIYDYSHRRRRYKKKLIAKIWTILMKKSMEFILVKFQISSV